MFQTIDFAGTIIFRLKENIAWWGKLQTPTTFGFTQLIYDIIFQIIWRNAEVKVVFGVVFYIFRRE